MKKKTSPKLESIKLKKSVVDKVRKNKDATGVAIGKFFELAAIKELQLPPLKNNP